jgi:hypothetical protein
LSKYNTFGPGSLGLFVDQKSQTNYTVIVVVNKEQKMAEVRVSHLYKVTMTEYESGWGQRPMGTKFFDNEAEARRFCEEYASGTYDCYFRATYQRVA